MKRLLMLAVLSLPAVLLSVSPASAQSPPVKGLTEHVTATTTPKRGRTSPYTFTTKGRIVPPSKFCAFGVSPRAGANCLPALCPPGATNGSYCTLPGRSVICSGLVSVQFKHRATTISRRSVGVRSDCTFESRVTFRTRVRGNVLSVRARFAGNAVLAGTSSSTTTVRAA